MPLKLNSGPETITTPIGVPTYRGDRPQIVTNKFAVATGLTAKVGQWYTQETGGLTEVKDNTTLTGKKLVLLVGLYHQHTQQIYNEAPIGTSLEVADLFAQTWATTGDTLIEPGTTFIRNNTTGLTIPFVPATHTALAGALTIITSTLPDDTAVTFCAIK
jgi:hypothetical protein